jgi:macrolide transport system ATP-binding/permease protein
MKSLRAWIRRLGGMFPDSQRERELEDEIESHLQMNIDDNLRAGMTLEQARREAILKLGGIEPTKQACRERSTLPSLESFGQDLRFTFRQLVKNPGFSFTAILTLALGLAATLAIFSFVDAVLIRPLPYHKAARLAFVTESVTLLPRANISYPDYLDWKSRNDVFSSLDVWNQRGYMLSTPEGVQLVRGARVSDGFFRTLGVVPALGRDFYAGEDLPSAPHSVMLSYAAWQKRFAGRPDAIGQSVTLSGIPWTIVGVLPKSFQFAPANADFWNTLHVEGSCDLRRSCHSLDGVGRMKDGITVERAQAEMSAIASQLEVQYPDSNRGQGARVEMLSDYIVGDVRPIVLLLLTGAGLLLVIACVNVASLLLVRHESRRREIAVRGAMGASRARLIRQLLTEGFVLVLMGTVLGLALASAAVRALVGMISEDLMMYMPYFVGLHLNSHALIFAGGLALLALCLFSLAPVSRLLRPDELHDDLSDASRTAAGTLWRRFGSNLVVVELAVAVVLLSGAGLLGKSLYRLLHVDVGFEPQHLATVQVAVSRTAYGKDEQIVALGRQIVGRLSAQPGVTSVGITDRLPASFNGNTLWIRIAGHPYHGEHNEVNQREVSADYFKTLQARLLRGRGFTDAEDASKPGVVVVNQALAQKYFPGEDPIGKMIGDTELSPKSMNQVIAIVDDFKEGPLDSEVWPAVYYPFNQGPDDFFSVLVRSTQAEQAFLPTIVATIHQLDPGIATFDEATMSDRIRNSPTAYLHRSSAWLVGGFAALALLLGVIGLYGVIAYSVSRRTREIGVRMALGAQRKAVYELILKEAGFLTGIGIAAGLACSIGAATLIRNLLFGVRTWDAPTLGAVTGLLALAALLASYLPARRAASVNPVEALRAE